MPQHEAQVTSAQTQAAAALEQSEIARRTLEASFRPMLVPILERTIAMRRFQALDGISVEAQTGPEPKCWIGLDTNQVERFFAVIPIRNVGPGPAVLSTNVVDAWFVPNFSGAQRLYSRPSTPIVSSGDTVDFVFYGLVDDFTRSVASAAPGTSRQATFTVRYFDVAQSYVRLAHRSGLEVSEPPCSVSKRSRSSLAILSPTSSSPYQRLPSSDTTTRFSRSFANGFE